MPDEKLPEPDKRDAVEERLEMIVSSVPDEIQGVINRWEPSWTQLRHWEPIALLVRGAVMLANPDDAEKARSWMAEVAKLAAWQVHDGYRPTAQTLFDPTTVDAYLTALKENGEATTRSCDTYRSTFKKIRERISAPAVPKVETRIRYTPSGRSIDVQPYCPVDVGIFRDRTKLTRDKRFSANLEALIVVVHDAGLNGGNESGWLMPDDIVDDGPAVRIDVWATAPGNRGDQLKRSVTITDPAAVERLRRVARATRVRGDDYVLGGNAEPKRRMNRSNVLAGKLSDETLKLEVKRLRETWVQRSVSGAVAEFYEAVAPLGFTGSYEAANLVYWYGPDRASDR
jgi:hypothetical protein